MGLNEDFFEFFLLYVKIDVKTYFFRFQHTKKNHFFKNENKMIYV